jgi:hypothetical protein
LELKAAGAAVEGVVLGGDRGAMAALGQVLRIHHGGRGRVLGGRVGGVLGPAEDVRAALGERTALGWALGSDAHDGLQPQDTVAVKRFRSEYSPVSGTA